MTFVPGSVPSLHGVPFAVEGDAAAVRLARQIVRDLGGEASPFPRSKKSAYHAWGGFTSPLLIALLVTGEKVARAAGLSAADARKKMLPIVRQTLANYAKLGPAGAFSGPIVRGDTAGGPQAREGIEENSRSERRVPGAGPSRIPLLAGAQPKRAGEALESHVNLSILSITRSIFRGASGCLVAIHHHGAEPNIAGGRFEARRHIVQKPPDHQFFLHADHAVIRASHADIGDVGGTVGQHALIGGRNVGVRADDRGDAAIEIPAQRDLLRRRFGMDIDEDHFRFDLFQQLVGDTKGIVVGAMNTRP